MGRPTRTPIDTLDALRERSLDLARTGGARLEPAGAELSATDVHEVRKHVKKLRAAWQFLRPALGRATARPPERSLRAVAKRLERHREAVALKRTVRRLAEGRARGKRGRGRCSEREALTILHGLMRAGDAVRLPQPCSDRDLVARFEVQAVAIADWPVALPPEDLAAGIRRSYRKARRGGRRAQRTDDRAKRAEHWHDARRAAKYERYQIELMGGVVGSRKRLRRLKKFAKVAGRHHDLEDLRDVIAAHAMTLKAAGARAPLERLVDRAQGRLEKKLRKRHAKLYGRRPKQRARDVLDHLETPAEPARQPAAALRIV